MSRKNMQTPSFPVSSPAVQIRKDFTPGNSPDPPIPGTMHPHFHSYKVFLF